MKTPKYHKAIAVMAPKRSARPELMQVHYENGTATAGDQFHMVRAAWPELAGIEGDAIAVHAQHADTVPLVLMERPDKYPNVGKLFSDVTEKEPLASASVNYRYLLDIVKALAPFTSSLQDVTIEYYGKGSPLVLKAGNKVKRTDAIALLMPLRM